MCFLALLLLVIKEEKSDPDTIRLLAHWFGARNIKTSTKTLDYAIDQCLIKGKAAPMLNYE
jgi:hypothetical protein